MALTRYVLQAHLERLDAAVDGLLASEGDHFFVAFAGIADAIADDASADGRCWVEDQALAMLERRGLVSLAEGEA
ncbi:MAG TPA: hypothetical protein VM687_10480 [Stenotrophomonas sp.]|nr:hypothetical protein [Stenotrophomonas sp.]